MGLVRRGWIWKSRGTSEAGYGEHPSKKATAAFEVRNGESLTSVAGRVGVELEGNGVKGCFQFPKLCMRWYQ